MCVRPQQKQSDWWVMGIQGSQYRCTEVLIGGVFSICKTAGAFNLRRIAGHSSIASIRINWGLYQAHDRIGYIFHNSISKQDNLKSSLINPADATLLLNCPIPFETVRLARKELLVLPFKASVTLQRASVQLSELTTFCPTNLPLLSNRVMV